MVDIDLKDRKILYQLDVNSRQTFNQIAKQVGLGKDSVIYRINKLKEEGVIKQFHTVIDVGKLGFISFRLYIKLQNTTPQKEEEITEFLKKQKIVTWLVSTDGQYDIGMWILTKSIKDMNALWKNLTKKYMNYIGSKWLSVFTKVSYFPRAYILDKKQNIDEYVFVTEPDDRKLDKKHLSMLQLMAEDSRISVLELAQKLKITPKTASSWIKDLEKNKVIIGYRTMFDLEKLGYQYFKLHINLHNTTEEKLGAFKLYVKSHPNIIYDNEVMGGYDMEIEIQTKDMQCFRDIVSDLKAKFSGIIKEYNYMIFYKEHKYVFFPV